MFKHKSIMMKHLLSILFAILITISTFATTTIKKEGNLILIGSDYYSISQLKFFYSADYVYVYDGTTNQNVRIGLYTDIVTNAGATFESASKVVDYLASLCVPVTYNYALSFGELTNVSSVYKFGRNPGVGVTEEIIWDGGGPYVFLDSAQIIKVCSTDDNDSLNGVSAWSVVVYGLDSAYNEINEVILLSGLDSVSSVNKYLRLYRAFVYKAGTVTAANGNNAGTISFTSDDSDNLQAAILPGNGQTLMAVFTVPAGYTGYITGYALGAGQGKAVLFKSKFRNCTEVNCAFTVKDIREIYQNTFIGALQTPLVIPEMTDMVISGTNLQAGDVSCSASFGIILRKN